MVYNILLLPVDWLLIGCVVGIALGDLRTAEQAIKFYQEQEPAGNAINSELQSFAKLKQFEGEATKAYEKKDFRKVVYCMDRCLDEAPTCQRYKTTKAECLAYLGTIYLTRRWLK